MDQLTTNGNDLFPLPLTNCVLTLFTNDLRTVPATRNTDIYATIPELTRVRTAVLRVRGT